MTATPLTYFGGKQRLAGRIDALMPQRRSFVEPFAGGAALFFHRARVEREVINDLDGAIVNFWRVVRDQPAALAAALEMTPFSREEWCVARDGVDDHGMPDVERARRFLVLVEQSFGRTCESWSVPSLGRGRGRWQPATWLGVPAKIRAVAGRLAGVAIEQRDGLELLEMYDTPEATIYVDPPYDPTTRSTRAGYRVDVDETFWPRLVDQLLEVEHAAVAVSGYPCDATERLEQAGWEVVRLLARRGAAGRAGVPTTESPEALWRNPACVEGTAQTDLLHALTDMEATT